MTVIALRLLDGKYLFNWEWAAILAALLFFCDTEHIGIRSNKLADRHTTSQSFRGAIAGSRRTATEGGIRRRAKEGSCRAAERKAERYGLGSRAQWGRCALSAYTWFRTGKGSQRQWLHTESARRKTSAALAEPLSSQATTSYGSAGYT